MSQSCLSPCLSSTASIPPCWPTRTWPRLSGTTCSLLQPRREPHLTSPSHLFAPQTHPSSTHTDHGSVMVLVLKSHSFKLEDHTSTGQTYSCPHFVHPQRRMDIVFQTSCVVFAWTTLVRFPYGDIRIKSRGCSVCCLTLREMARLSCHSK